ncbi:MULTISPECIES: chemotaxis protein CheB [Streptomyces]|uniref:chemotaxis protein CheB n=1 Tax=Streptomyces TaxID=1883 RepID=UPI002277995B
MSRGVRAAQAAGGTVIVQDPAPAEFRSMSQSSIGTGAVDFVPPLDSIAPAIDRIVRRR